MKGEYRLNGRIMLRSHPLVNVVLQVALMIAQDLRQGGHWVTQLTCSWSTRALIKALSVSYTHLTLPTIYSV